jgi:hypothetical protein
MVISKMSMNVQSRMARHPKSLLHNINRDVLLYPLHHLLYQGVSAAFSRMSVVTTEKVKCLTLQFLPKRVVRR